MEQRFIFIFIATPHTKHSLNLDYLGFTFFFQATIKFETIIHIQATDFVY